MKSFEQPRIKKEKEAEIEAPEFEMEDFEATKYHFANLAKQLTPAIYNHEYNLVMGDDASGRIPTLVIGGLMKEIYSEDKVKSPEILFLAGQGLATEGEKKELDNYLQKIIKEKKINPEKTKVLIVTEYMHTGGNVAYLFGGLTRAGLSCDVATLSTYLSAKSIYKNRPSLKDVKMYIGEEGGRLRFWGERQISGVIKKDSGIFTAKTKFDNPIRLKQAREEVKKMIACLKQIYDREKEKLEKKEN